MSIDISKVLALPVEERIQIAQSIWDSVAECPEAVNLTAEQSKVLEQRLKAYKNDPTAGSPWPEVRKKILASR